LISGRNEVQSRNNSSSVTPCRCPDTKNGDELWGEEHDHQSYPKQYPTDPNVDSPPSGDDIAKIWKGLQNTTRPLYYTSIIETESVRYAIVVVDVGVAKNILQQLMKRLILMHSKRLLPIQKNPQESGKLILIELSSNYTKIKESEFLKLIQQKPLGLK
jgi:hypothetical protein